MWFVNEYLFGNSFKEKELICLRAYNFQPDLFNP